MTRNRSNILSLVGPRANYATQKSILKSVMNTRFMSSRAPDVMQNMKPSFLGNEFVNVLNQWKEGKHTEPRIDDVLETMKKALENGAIIADKNVLYDIVNTLFDYKHTSLEDILPRFLKIMEALLKQPRIDINKPPVIFAIANNIIYYKTYFPSTHGKVLRWCKKHGADFSIRSYLDDWTPVYHILAYCIRRPKKNFDLAGAVGLFVDLGVDPNAVMTEAEERGLSSGLKASTALHLCPWLRNNQMIEAVATALLSRGANPNIPMRDARDVEVSLASVCVFGQVAPTLMPILVAHGMNPNIRNKHGEHVLAWIAYGNHMYDAVSTFEFLLELGANPAMREEDNDTVLHTILRNFKGSDENLEAIVKMCIDARPNIVNLRGAGGTSLLYVAGRRKQIGVEVLLIQAGGWYSKRESERTERTERT